MTSIILTLLFSSFEDLQNRETADNNKFKSIYQLSYQHCGLAGDSIVLNRDNSDEMYNKIYIYRGQKIIFEYTDKDLEIIGSPFCIFTEQEIITCKENFYIFKLSNAPGPDKFLIIKSTKDTTSYFGTTKSSTAEIFRDIDYDGKFEIGGFEWYCEASDSSCFPKNLYSVFEVDTGFPIDTTLTMYFKQFIK